MSGCQGIARPLILLVITLAGVLHMLVSDPGVFSAAKNHVKTDTASELLSNEVTIHRQADDLDFTDSSGLAPLQEPAELWLWCQLDVRNVAEKHFQHFPHASQALLPCWSWFQKIKRARSHRMRIRTTGVRTHCGFYIKDKLGKKVRPDRWIGQLIQLMGCSVTETAPTGSISSGKCEGTAGGTMNCGVGNTTLVYRLPPDDYYSLKYFKRPEDAATLRAKILRSLNFKEDRRTTRAAARIAIVNRQRTRRILNLDSMVAAISATFPNAIVDTAYMEDMKPADQLLYWSQHDIIVTGHGAAITNSIMLPPGNSSAVVEIFPPHYYPEYFFGRLLKSAGIRGYGYFNGVSDYIADHEVHSRTIDDRNLYRNQNLKPPVSDILDLVTLAMLEGGFLSDGRAAPHV